MNKRGQITLFIILGLVIIIILGIIFYFKSIIFSNSNQEKYSSISPQIKTVGDFINNCVKIIGEEGIAYTGQQSGYYKLPEKSTENNIAYYLDERKLIPPLSAIENSISSYVNENLDLCIKNFSDLKGFKFKTKKVSTRTSIKDKAVILNVNYPVEVIRAKSEYQLSEFKLSIPVRLGIIYNVSSNIIDEQLKDKNNICLTCLVNIGNGNDLKINLANYENDTIIFTILDEKSKLNNQPYGFNFAVKYEI